MKIPEFKIRTDLALEEREGLKEAAEEVSGVSFKKWEGKRSAAQITEVKVLNEHGAKALGKPMGSYLTLEADKLLMPDEDFHSEVSDELALLLKGLLKQKTGKNILVAGLGNQSVTPDSLGPRTVSNLCVSAEGLKAIAPGVMAQTGMETARILLGIIKEVQPDLVIAIDALAARFFFSKYHMMRKFKEETGCTIHSYVTSKRLLLARSLIARGTPVMKAALQSGFRDYTTFSRAYKKQFRQPPARNQ